MVARPGLWLLAVALLGLSAVVLFFMRERKGTEANIHVPAVQRAGRGTPGLRSPYPPPPPGFAVDAGSVPLTTP